MKVFGYAEYIRNDLQLEFQYQRMEQVATKSTINMAKPFLEYTVLLNTSTGTPFICWKSHFSDMHHVLHMFLMHIYLSGNRLHLSIRSPKNKTFISHVEDVTLPKSSREAHGLQLGTICVENHVQILSNQWIVLEV